MTIDLYYSPASSQCQAIQMVAASLGIELNLIAVNLQAGEHLKPEFVAINPQHTIPTLHDNGFALWETRAILTYLVEKYGGPKSALFPGGDAQKRAVINQRLYFDMGTLYQSFAGVYYAQMFAGTEPTEEAKQKIVKAFEHLDTFLAKEQFVAGDELTVADFAIWTTVSLFEVVEYEFGGNANVSAWYKRLAETIPGKELAVAGQELMRTYIKLAKEKRQ